MIRPDSPLARLRRLVGDLLFPPRCVTCPQAGALWCERCRQRVDRFAAPRCPRCDLPAPSEARPCAACQRDASPLTALRVVGPHREPLRGAIHALKYERRVGLAAPLAALLVERWGATGFPVAGVIPVPLHPNRERERGFNQCLLLAQPFAESLTIALRPDLLGRERDTPHQVGLGRGARLSNVAGAFVAAPGASGAAWLLVDDVCTSGATLAASAEALLAAGATAVYALTLARPRHGERDGAEGRPGGRERN